MLVVPIEPALFLEFVFLKYIFFLKFVFLKFVFFICRCSELPCCCAEGPPATEDPNGEEAVMGTPKWGGGGMGWPSPVRCFSCTEIGRSTVGAASIIEVRNFFVGHI